LTDLSGPRPAIFTPAGAFVCTITWLNYPNIRRVREAAPPFLVDLNLMSVGLCGVLALLVWLLVRTSRARDVAETTARNGAALSAAEARLAEALQRVSDVTERLHLAEAERQRAHDVIARLQSENGGLQAELAGAGERQAILARAEEQLRDSFRALAADALQQNSDAVLRLARATLGEFQTKAAEDLERRQHSIAELLKPIGDVLHQVDTKLAAVERDRLTTTARLDEQIRALGSGLVALSGQTGELVRALRQPHIRGHWGEVQLRRIVELAGMVEHCDFVEQPTIETVDGRLRPDLIVRLPGDKTIVVDAKAPLSAYLEAIDGPEPARDGKLVEHARQVRDHMSRLAAKEYSNQFAASPDFVIMFLPGESVFSAAVHADPALIETGVIQRVIPASPTTLIAMLKAVAYAWRQERIAENAERISALGREVYQRLAVTATHIETIGASLTRSVEAYNRAVGSLEARVFPAARRFRELGSAPDAEIEPLQPVQASVRAVQAPEFQNLLEIVEATESPAADRPPS
jgi:DNA recombination protein RmuC